MKSVPEPVRQMLAKAQGEADAAREELRKEREIQRDREYVAKAAGWSNLQIDATEFGIALRKVADINSDIASVIERAFDAVNEQQEAAAKKLTETQTAKTAADDAKNKAQADLTAAQQFQTQAQQEKQRADQFLQQKTQESNARQVNVDVPSNTLQFRLVQHPLVVDAFPDTASLKAGEKLELPVKVTRKYDYKSGITLQTTLPQGITGLQLPAVTIPENQGETKLQITTAANATVGDHLLTVRFTMNFNGQNLTFDQIGRAHV